MKAELNPAFILHRRPYRETSLLLDTFTRDHGRLGLIAKGIRKKNSNKSELLQPYQRLMIAWTGKSDLMTLTDVEADNTAYTLTKDRLLTGFYLNELIIRVLHQHEAHPELFDIYDQTLNLISNDQANEQAVVRIFEKRLLDSVGYGLVLDHDIDTGLKIDPDILYYYQADRGPSSVMPDIPDFKKISGKTLIELDNEEIMSSEILHEAKSLMRYILQKHTGSKPLQSRELYKSFLETTRSNNRED